MNVSEIVIGLAVGIAIGAMDFSLAKSIAMMIRPANARAILAVMIGGFALRIALIGTALWFLSRAGGISFIAVCIGLTGVFTFLTLGHTIRATSGTARMRKQASDRG